MECLSISVVVWSGLVFSASLLVWFGLRKSKNGSGANKLPPGPPGWPVVGNMFDLIGTLPHQNLYKLRHKYGPVVYLKLGSVDTMVVQSAAAAEEMFKKHDPSFSDRKRPDVLKAHNYEEGSLAFGHYGEYWRMTRRLCVTELVAHKRINDTAPVRQKCVEEMVKCVEEETAAAWARGEAGEVNLSNILFLMTFNLIGNQILSRDVVESQQKEGLEFFEAMKEIMELSGKPNVADYFPLLKWLDPQGLRRKVERNMGIVLRIVGGFVKERVEEKKLLGRQRAEKDFLDALLDGEEGTPHNISYHNVNILVLEMFFAGSETLSTTLEWVMAELLHNPDLMRKVKDEVDLVVGSNKKVQESDIDQLPYLQAVVKESLRLHPTIPLLLPRNTIQDTNFMGYLIPKNTQIFVNAWGIGRDPDSWEDPQSFKPERFLSSNINYNGQNFELIPFGSGRRICAGLSLAHRVLHLALASLIHCFDWELGGNVTSETMDMNEKLGVSMRMVVPLKAIPKKRFI